MTNAELREFCTQMIGKFKLLSDIQKEMQYETIDAKFTEWELKKLIFALNVLREEVRKYVDTADTPQTEERPAGCSKDWSASCTSCERYFSCDYLSGRQTGTGSPIGDYRDGAGAWAPMPLGDPGSISDGTLLTALETWLNRNPDKQIRVDKRITRRGPVFTASIEPAPWTIQKEE